MTTTYSPEELPSLVTEGALFMDAIDPEWFWIVNPETLRMQSASRCVLGQHCGTFDPFQYRLTMDDVKELAFAILFNPWPRGETSTEWNRLWRDEINDRRAAWLAKHSR